MLIQCANQFSPLRSQTPPKNQKMITSTQVTPKRPRIWDLQYTWSDNSQFEPVNGVLDVA
eukprot:3607224-Amphidinium_carterae.1